MMDFGTMRRRSAGAVLTGSVFVLFATTAWAQQGGTQSDQGTHVNGTGGDRYERIGILLSSAKHLGVSIQASLDAGQLTGAGSTLTGSLFKDVTFSSTVNNQSVTFKILSARNHVNVYTGIASKTAWEYQVTWESANGSGDLCPDRMSALALPGYWKGNVFVPSDNPTTVFSFACVPNKVTKDDGSFHYEKGGVAAKCVDWGFPPWLNKDRLPGDGVYPATSISEALRYHVSCVAMASADYCGEARSNTVDGTPIVMFNTLNVENGKDSLGNPTSYVAGGPFGSGGAFLFEAAWATVSVRDVTGMPIGLRPKALCLTKKRWSTLPLNGTCTLDTTFVQDPRVAWTTSNPPRFCDDIPKADLLTQGALMFSYSTYIDAGLYRFVNPKTGAYLTTSQVDIGASGKYSAYKPDIAGTADFVLDTGAGSARPVYEGPLFSMSAPSTSPGLEHTAPLLRYRGTAPDGSLRFVTLVQGAQVPTGFVPDGSNNVEGYVYVGMPPAGGAPALRAWQKNPVPGFLTTTGDMAAQSYLNYSGSVPMGYLPSMNAYSQLP